MNDFPSQAGHYYTRDGQPAYTITGKNGKERNTTLRDAREHGYLPSVTTILRVIAAPGLENWKLDQAILSALTATRLEGEDDKAFISRIKRDAKEQAMKAAEFGTRVHGAIECHYLGKPYDPSLALFVQGAVEQVEKYFPGGGWIAEKSFASPLGYGGKVDMHRANGTVIDFKGKDGDLQDLDKIYDEHAMQLSAYAVGLFGCSIPQLTTANVFFSRTHPGIARTIIHSEAEREKGWRMFQAALELWQAQKDYEP